jgi:IS5 family transposase
VGANPVDRAKPGSKLHLAADNQGLPLSLLVTAANANDAVVFEALLDDLPLVATPRGGRRCRPDKCHADKAYDHRRCRAYLTRRGIRVRIARRGVDSSKRLGVTAGRLSARSRGWLGAGACASARTAPRSGSSPSRCWPATGSATTACPTPSSARRARHDHHPELAAAGDVTGPVDRGQTAAPPG